MDTNKYINSGDLDSCYKSVSDLNRDIIYSADDESAVTAPYMESDGTGTSGVRITQKISQSGEFTICFDDTEVMGTQNKGLIGLRDSSGMTDACTVYATVPDFCGAAGPGMGPGGFGDGM